MTVLNSGCCFQDCLNPSSVTVGKLNAPVCHAHAIVYQKLEGQRN